MKRLRDLRAADLFFGKEVHSDYVGGRRTNAIFAYGAGRRVAETIQALNALDFPGDGSLLDLGTADGQLLVALQAGFSGAHCEGIDINPEYVEVARSAGLEVTVADATNIPNPACSLDAVVATAVLKHIEKVEDAIFEAHRVLKPAGVFIIIDPTPAAVSIGTHLGYFLPGTIFRTWDIATYRTLLGNCGFEIVLERRFMLSPRPFPGMAALEYWLTRIGLGGLLLNQLICGRKVSHGDKKFNPLV